LEWSKLVFTKANVSREKKVKYQTKAPLLILEVCACSLTLTVPQRCLGGRWVGEVKDAAAMTEDDSIKSVGLVWKISRPWHVVVVMELLQLNPKLEQGVFDSCGAESTS
jgi:hypothetical protein